MSILLHSISSHSLWLQNSCTCSVCNGYYAPSFGEPLCGTCHAFLFPVIAEEKRSTDLSDNDEDSGNDEPAAHAMVFVFENEEGNGDFDVEIGPPEVDDNDEGDGLAVMMQADEWNEDVPPRPNDRMAIYENAFLGNRPDPQPPRNLRQYLNALTEAHEANPNPNRQGIANDINGASAMNAKPGNTISALPVEVLLVIFSYLDDISLCHVGQVCKQWKNIVEVHTPQSLWEKYTKTRWPLYHQITETNNWLKVYE